jgi:hypothetical protein
MNTAEPTTLPTTDLDTAPDPAPEAPIPDWVRFFPMFPRLERRILTSGNTPASE